MRHYTTIIITATVVLVVAIAIWSWFSSNDSSGETNVGTERNGPSINESSASPREPMPPVETLEPQFEERDESRSNESRDEHLAAVIKSVTLRGQALLRDWELSSFKPIEFANTLLEMSDSSTAVMVLPRPDEATESDLYKLLISEISDSSIEPTPSDFDRLKAAIGWPRHSRVVLAQAVSDAEDSVMVFENADEKSVSIDPITGNVSIDADGSSLEQLDLAFRNRYSHLFGVSPEQ